MSGTKIAESIKASKSGDNNFPKAFRECPVLTVVIEPLNNGFFGLAVFRPYGGCWPPQNAVVEGNAYLMLFGPKKIKFYF